MLPFILGGPLTPLVPFTAEGAIVVSRRGKGGVEVGETDWIDVLIANSVSRGRELLCVCARA